MEQYHQSIGIAGLHYISFGIGLSVAAQVNSRMLDKLYKSLSARNGGVGKPEFRLRMLDFLFSIGLAADSSCILATMFPGTLMLPIGLLLFGWAAEAHLPWIVLDIVSSTLLHFDILHLSEIYARRVSSSSAQQPSSPSKELQHIWLMRSACIQPLVNFAFLRCVAPQF